MPKIHYFQRYSQPENAVTNNTLQLLARIYNYSPLKLSQLLTDLLGDESIEIGVEIGQQSRGKQSVPDAHLIQRSFKILVEAKVDSGINFDQLIRHSKSFTDEKKKILLLLTVAKAPNDLIERIHIHLQPEGVIFKNITYEDICKSASGLFLAHETDIKEIVDDYLEYCSDLRLIDYSSYFMRITPCGDTHRLNRKYAIYYMPSDRGYSKHKFVGIYKNKKVDSFFEIDAVFDIEYDGSKLTEAFVEERNTDEYDQKIIDMIIEAKTECGHLVNTGHRFFCGKEIYETEYIKESSGGIMGARFHNMKEVAKSYQSLGELAQILRTVKWN